MTDPDLSCPIPKDIATTVLICDERPVTRRGLTALLTTGTAPCRVIATGEAAGMIQEFGSTPTDLVMIGMHHGSGTGITTMTRLLDSHPSAQVIVYGPAQDTALLTSAVARGARGLMIWTPGTRAPPSPHPAHGPRPDPRVAVPDSGNRQCR